MEIKLDGVHHVTGVTADVQRNADFWVGILGLRFVGKTLNFETTFRYHSYFGDETGSPGSVVTFAEVALTSAPMTSPVAWEAPTGRPGEGNIISAVLRVRSFEAIEFWLKRLASHQVHSEMFRLDPASPERLVFHDFEGHCVELIVDRDNKVELIADAGDDIPAEFRITGIDGVRSAASLETVLPEAAHLGFKQAGDILELRGPTRTARWRFADPATVQGPYQPLAVGVWHHLALDAGATLQAARDEANAGPVPWTGVLDHYLFDSAYALSPGGMLELCSAGPGFLVNHRSNDELGEVLALSPWTEPLRERLERELAPIVNPRPRSEPVEATPRGKGQAKRPRSTPGKDEVATSDPTKADPITA